jgi:uncharacterized membrane protein YfcA
VSVGVLLLLVGLSLIGAFVAGLVGVGGAIVMIPLLLYGPPLLGAGRLDARTVTAVTMVQVFVAALAAVVVHRRRRAVRPDLSLMGGLAMAAGSLTGAIASRFTEDHVLVLVFALMTLVALALMFVPVETAGMPIFADHIEFSRARAVGVCLVVGLVAGLVGAGGAFLLVPLLLVFVGIPLAAAAGVTGKLVTGQVPLQPALAVVLGAVPGAHLGALVSRRLSGRALRRVLLVVILVSAVRVWWDVLTR